MGQRDECANFLFRLLHKPEPQPVTQIIVLIGDAQRKRAEEAVRTAPTGNVVKRSEPTRNGEQNAKFHALCSDAERMCEWAGKKWDAHDWKIIFISAHAVATGRPATIVPGLEGELVNVREQTSRMSKDRMSSLIAYTEAWIAENRDDTRN